MEEQEKIYDISDEYEAIKALKREYNKRHPATEYWTMADGNLESGWYYTKHDDGKIYVWLCFKDDCSYIENPEVKEILAPVPSYNELTLMRGNYILAKNALRDCYNEMKYWATMNHRCRKIFNHIKGALVEIEEVK